MRLNPLLIFYGEDAEPVAGPCVADDVRSIVSAGNDISREGNQGLADPGAGGNCPDNDDRQFTDKGIVAGISDVN